MLQISKIGTAWGTREVSDPQKEKDGNTSPPRDGFDGPFHALRFLATAMPGFFPRHLNHRKCLLPDLR